MLTVNANGVKTMGFSSDFKKEMLKQGVRDPFAASLALFSEKCTHNADGSISYKPDPQDPREPTRAEKDEWIIKRDEYIARRCFYEIGYEAFLAHTKPGSVYDISYMRDLDEFVPCRACEAQCTMFCKNIGGNCNEENL